MMKKLFSIALSAALCISMMPAFTFANEECDHNWIADESDCTYVDEFEHKVTYYCDNDNCGSYKYENEPHDWIEEDCSYADDSKHVITYYCDICGGEKHENEAHNWELDSIWPIDKSKHEVSYYCAKCEGYKSVDGQHSWKMTDSYPISYNYSSASKHIVTYDTEYTCSKCDEIKNVKVKKSKSHSKSKYDLCTECTFPSTKGTLKSNKYVYKSKKPWLKINVKKTGYVKLSKSSNVDYITIYNSSKKKLYKLDKSYGNFDSFAVKKGTYYIKADAAGANYKIKYKFHAAKETKSRKAAKTLKLKKNKTVRGTFFYDGKKKNWETWGSSDGPEKLWIKEYKIKLTKKQKVKVYFTGLDTLYTEVKILNSKGDDLSTRDIYKGNALIGLQTSKKLKKGTYRIWLEFELPKKMNNYGPSYTLKWK